MSTIATLNVLVTADNESFIRAFDKSSKKAEEFSAEMLTSRASVQTFAGFTDQAAGPLMHLVHAFEVLPGPIGLVVGALFAAKEAYDAIAESSKNAMEQQLKTREVMEEIGKAAGEIETFDGLAKNADDQINKLEAAVVEKSKDIKKQLDSVFGSTDQGVRDKGAIEQFEREEQRWVQLRRVVKDFESDMQRLNKEKLRLQIAGDDQMPILKAQAELVQQTLFEAFDPKTTKALQKELDNINQEMARIDKHGDLKVAERHKREAEELKKLNEEIQKQVHASTEHDHQEYEKMRHEAERIGDALRTPGEKFVEDISRASELFEKGLLSDATLAKYFDAQQKILEKDSTHEIGSTSTFKQIDPSKISAVGLAKQSQRTTVHDEGVEKAIREGHERMIQAIRERNANPATVAGG